MAGPSVAALPVARMAFAGWSEVQPKRRRQHARPSMYADDHLAPGERRDLGDDEAMSVALDRSLAARRRYRPAPITEDDLAAVRPGDVDEKRDDETAREVLAWRAATLAGQPLAWRTKGPKR